MMIVKQITPLNKEVELSDLAIYSDSRYSLTPFDERTVNFFDSLSKRIVKNPDLNRLPEMVALAFWIRKSNLLKLKSENEGLLNNPKYRVSPIGRVFHICPTNVDTMFIYSLAVSILMGNKNILRISSRMDAMQINILFGLLNEVLSEDEYEEFNKYINIISYNHNEEISKYISLHSNARIIWGGDNTIETFRKFLPMPRTKDIVFADRVSVLCINTKAYLDLNDHDRDGFAKVFFNDAYTFDQKGCSSPQAIYMLGTQEDFVKSMSHMPLELSRSFEEKFGIDVASVASLKLNQLVDDVVNDNAKEVYGNNIVKFVEVTEQESNSLHHTCGGGYFYVSRINSIRDLESIVSSKLQTISYFGLNEFEKSELLNIANSEGIDRIVPLGKALEFSYIWDGYNLFDEVSRKVYFE